MSLGARLSSSSLLAMRTSEDTFAVFVPQRPGDDEYLY
jgi:hypothetical protein